MNVEYRCRGWLIFETPAYKSYSIPAAFIHEGVLYGVRTAEQIGETVVVECGGPPPNELEAFVEQRRTDDVPKPGDEVRVSNAVGSYEPTADDLPPFNGMPAFRAESAKECGRVGCGKPATVVARWGKRSWASCDDHRNELEPYCEFEPIPQVPEREGNP